MFRVCLRRKKLVVLTAIVFAVVCWLVFPLLGCPALDEKIAKDILRGRVISEISTIQIRDRRETEAVEWVVSGKDQVAVFFDLLLHDRSRKLQASGYKDGIEVTFVFSDARQCDLSFALFSGGVYFGDECRSYEESGWLIPAAKLYEWVIHSESLDN
ncbi:hypothetical protein COB72_11160 [bacterium]|nr:MAG: hypothetical protein COB72_11160 [bacterium]